MPFIKSHSNYVLKKRHQDVYDGTIFERDITTIGGIGTFPMGQVPVYRSSNFIITVNGGNTVSKETAKKGENKKLCKEQLKKEKKKKGCC